MPVVTVQLWSGRTVEQKRRLVAAITQAMIDHADCKPDHLHVIIQDVPKDSWGRAGRLGIDNEPDPVPVDPGTALNESDRAVSEPELQSIKPDSAAGSRSPGTGGAQ